MDTLIQYISNIPAWLGAGIMAAFGWFGHIVYGEWLRYRTPFIEDKKHFECIVSSIDINAMYFFEESVMPSVPRSIFDRIVATSIALDDVAMYRSAIHGGLKKREKKLINAIESFCASLSWHSHLGEVMVVFDGKTSIKKRWFYNTTVQNEIDACRCNMIVAYEDYRDFGNKLFATKFKVPSVANMKK